MRITRLEPDPVARIPFVRAARGGGPEDALLDVLAARVDRLPDGLGALVVTADLQGYAVDERSRPRLLGEAVAEQLGHLASTGRLVSREDIGVLLAGD